MVSKFKSYALMVSQKVFVYSEIICGISADSLSGMGVGGLKKC